MSKEKVSIPGYSLSEELLNSISHGSGAVLGIAALTLCVIKAALSGDAWAVVSAAVYGGTLVIMYTLSCIYHALKINRAKRVFRVLDHCGVFLVLAGTYTPYTLVSLRGPLGFTIFGIIWGFTVIGIVFNAIDVDKYQGVSAIINLITGWGIVFAIVPLARVLPFTGLVLLIVGGACYTVGAVLYALGARIPYFHSIFHLFVIAGSALHFFSIFWYVI